MIRPLPLVSVALGQEETVAISHWPAVEVIVVCGKHPWTSYQKEYGTLRLAAHLPLDYLVRVNEKLLRSNKNLLLISYGMGTIHGPRMA